MRVPWTARRSKQSILKEISPGISLEGMMLKLKLQYFGPLSLLQRGLAPRSKGKARERVVWVFRMGEEQGAQPGDSGQG